MDEKMYTITLSDGQTLTDVKLNGNTFISKKEIKKDIFDSNLWNVIINDGEEAHQYTNMKLAYYHFDAVSREYQFTLTLPTFEEMERERMWSAIEYLSMMTGVDF